MHAQSCAPHLIPRARGTLARERARHPRVLVGEVPNGDAHTLLDVHARLHDRLEVLLLLRERGLRRRRRRADVELRDRDLEPERGELLEDRLERRRDLADDEVALEADTVDGHSVGDELLHKVEHCGRLGTCERGATSMRFAQLRKNL